MGSDSRWINGVWWRDWLFWVGAVVATVILARGLAVGSSPWWSLVLGWLVSFSVTVAVVGFGRVVVRTYREPDDGGQRR